MISQGNIKCFQEDSSILDQIALEMEKVNILFTYFILLAFFSLSQGN